MRFEDELRATMREHDADAPGSLEFEPPGRSRRSWALPLAAAAAVAAAAVGISVLPADRTETATAPPSTLRCPAKYLLGESAGGWLPRDARFDGADQQLVPDATPGAAVVCGFERAKGPGRGAQRAVALAGSRRVTHGLAEIPGALAALPRSVGSVACRTFLVDTDLDNYLIGLRYRGSVVWVAAPGNHCAGATNGSYRTRTNLRAFALNAYRTGEVRVTRPKPCAYSAGRSGDDRDLVPEGPVAVDVCVEASNGAPGDLSRTLAGSALRSLADSLNGLRAASEVGCKYRAGPDKRRYELVFRYRSGPTAFVRVDPRCVPQVSNAAGLYAEAPSDLLDRVRALAG